MTEPDATQRLRHDLAASPETAHLAGCLARIEAAVTRTWESNAMPWFTDHGEAHSRRVAQYADQLAGCPEILEHHRLTVVERFILYAACWLHDIGMQDFTDAGPLGGPDVNYARVRHEHPDRTARLLLRDWASYGLPADDPGLAEAVADVARAHGTDTYASTVKEMRDGSMVACGREVRGPLLACLLLMADELDLRHERVREFTGEGRIASVSAAHAFKHRCVQSSEVTYPARRGIGIRLVLRFPKELPVADADEVQRWIVLKLRRQMAMVEAELLDGLGVSFDRRIRVKRAWSRTGWAPPDQEALAVIRADNARDRVIDHRAVLGEAARLAGRPGMLVVRGDRDGDVDVDGREDILDALDASARAGGRAVLVSGRARDARMASAGDVVSEWLDGALDRPADTVPQRQAEPAEELEQLVQAIVAGERRWLLLLSCADLVGEVDRKWLFGEAVPRLLGAGDVTVAVTAGRTTPVPEGVSELDAHDLDRDGVRLHLMRYLGGDMGRDTAEALTSADDESEAKPYSRFKEMVEKFEEKFTLDDDRPRGVHP